MVQGGEIMTKTTKRKKWARTKYNSSELAIRLIAQRDGAKWKKE